MTRQLSLLSDFFGFVKNPENNTSEISKGKKIKNILILLGCSFLINIIIGFILEWIIGYYEIKNIPSHVSLSKNFAFHLISVAIVAPLIEEIAYRLPLIFNKLFIALSAGTLTFIWISKLYYQTMVFSAEGLLYKSSFALCAGVLVYLLLKNKNIFIKVQLFWKNKFRWIVYTSVLLFGYMHLFNYEIKIWTLLFSPFLVLPQINSGIITSYIRIRYGFIYALAKHSLWNLVVVVLASG